MIQRSGATRERVQSTKVRAGSSRVKDDLIVALAELYLDTDVRCDLPRVAERIVRAGLPEHELHRLWCSQITPVVHWNLKQAAGEWAGFDRAWLLDEVSKRAGKPGLEAWPWIGGWVHRMRAHGAEREFAFALSLAARLSQLREEERPRRTALWQALMHVYYAVDVDRDEAAEPERASAPVQFSHRIAQQLIDRQRIEPSELLEEFRTICDLLAELLSSEERKRVAEAHVAAWLAQLVG